MDFIKSSSFLIKLLARRRSIRGKIGINNLYIEFKCWEAINSKRNNNKDMKWKKI